MYVYYTHADYENRVLRLRYTVNNPNPTLYFDKEITTLHILCRLQLSLTMRNMKMQLNSHTTLLTALL